MGAEQWNGPSAGTQQNQFVVKYDIEKFVFYDLTPTGIAKHFEVYISHKIWTAFASLTGLWQGPIKT